MSADVLREAARLMRQRAEAATPGEWTITDWPTERGDIFFEIDTADENLGAFNSVNDADHVASWHPDVALAVADWLLGESLNPSAWNLAALAVARAYLNP